jgi:ribosomal subunit interface protein
MAEMEILIHDRTGAVPLRTQAYARRKLRRVGRHLDLLTEAEIEFTEESSRSQEPIHVVDLTARGVACHLAPLRARESGRELLATVDLAVDTLDREVRKLKERIRPHP